MTRRLGMALGGAVLGLRAECERQGGWWHPGGLRDGFCEYDSRQ